MRRLSVVLIAAPALACGSVLAEESPAASTQASIDWTSDYVFRGLSQRWGAPAVQGGVTYARAQGVALSVWASSISRNSYPGGAFEADLDASYGRTVATDGFWRVGLHVYRYPGALYRQPGTVSRSPDTTEAYVTFGGQTLSLKYSQALTDYFGADTVQGYRGGSRGTNYLELNGAWALGAVWRVALHVGRTRYTTRLAIPLTNGARRADYSDAAFTLTRKVTTHWSVSAGLSDTFDAAFYRHTASYLDATEQQDIGGRRVQLTLQGDY